MEILKIDGSGYGYGYGSGSGDGSGSGYGYGYGYGSGDGSGYRDGYWIAVFKQFFSNISGCLGYLAFWKSDSLGRPSNGGSGTLAHNGLVETIPGPLEICTRHALHATIEPTKYKGERLWLVEMRGELQFNYDKVGSLEREIVCELVEPCRE